MILGILYGSPLPPARTGVATYSAAVLAQLREIGFHRRHRVEAPWPLGGRIEELAAAADLGVYHVGNNAEFHADLYRLAIRHPGLVVLHDLGLDDLGRWFVDVGDPLGARTQAEAEAAAEVLAAAGLEVPEPLGTPWPAYLVRRSRGVIVHSAFGRRYLRALGCRTPVFVVPHPVIDPPRAPWREARRARAIRGRLADAVIVGVLGDIGASKGIDAVLSAAGRIGDPVHVAVVGRRIPGYDVGEAVRRSEAGERVTVETDVSDERFHAWLLASDVVVVLRHPHRGEVSGTLLRALAAGKPTVVQAVGTYLDWPEDAVVRIPPGPPDAGAVEDALRGLAADPRRRRATGERARAMVARQRAERATAGGYERAVEATMRLVRDPARDALARWARALAGLGADGTRVAGLGIRYVEGLDEVAGFRGPGVDWASGREA